MMRRKLAALLAAILFGTAAVPTTIAYAQGNDPDAASVTEVTETTEKEDPEQAEDTAEAGETEGEITEEEALSEVARLITGNPDFFSAMIGDMDPETLELLIAEAVEYFEVLPLEQDLDILRNILYSGVWQRYTLITEKAKRKEEAHAK